MDVTSPNQLRHLLKEYALVPLKQLGQNFLIDHNIVNKIIQFADIDSDDFCLEIGPGAGALSCGLCERAGKLVAIDIDKGMVELLRYVLEPYENVEIIHGDALKYDLTLILPHDASSKIKVVANLPYYITSPLLFKLLSIGDHIQSMTLMVQKEVAQRIAAHPGSGDYGALSVLVQNRCNVVSGFKVPPDCFFPRPNVESSVIHLNLLDISRSGVEDKLFEKVVFMAFTQKRKTLLNNLCVQTGQTKEVVSAAIAEAGLLPSVRAEQLGVEQYSALAKTMGKFLNLKG